MMCGKNPEEHWLSCQLTFCPLGSETFLDEIEEALEIIRQSGLEYEIGSMSTIVKGPGSQVLALLERIAVTMDQRGCRPPSPTSAACSEFLPNPQKRLRCLCAGVFFFCGVPPLRRFSPKSSKQLLI